MRTLATLAVLLLAPVLVRAQNPSTQPAITTATPTDRAEVAAAEERTASDPTLQSTSRSTAPGIAFKFSNDETTATAQIGGGMGSGDRWGLTVSGPLQKGITTLATDEGLNNGFSAELLLRRITFTRPLTSGEITALCRQYIRPEFSASFAQSGNCVHDHLTPEGQVLFENKFKASWAYGGSFKVGRTGFDFTTPTEFGDQSESHDGWSASATAGRFQAGALSSLLYYVGASYRHEEAYRPGGTATNICTPIPSSTSAYCREIVVGAPQRTLSNILQLEARSFIGRSVGLAPRVTLETNESEWSINVPVYLRDVEGPFNGGVSIGWNSRDKDIALSLFVGALPRIFN